MNPRSKTALILAFLSLGLFAAIASTHAATPIAKITQFKGEVLIVSGEQLSKVTGVGQPINDGDSVQTRNGEAHITFNDGAMMTIRPYTNTLIQEAEEQSGWFLFKTKDLVRRITCQVGNLWFKSGASGRKNYLQSPTAVCGLRGSAADFGFNHVMTYLREIDGSFDTMGPVARVTADFFDTLQANAQNVAGQNPVYNKLNDAYNRTLQAQKTGTALDQAGAKVALLDAVKLSIESILKNPHLPPEAREILNSTLQKVNSDLKDAQNLLNSMTGQPTTVTIPTTTTTVSIPTTTTTTSVTTTTTSQASPTSSYMRTSSFAK